MKKNYIFIIGPRKCGTSHLYNLISSHKNVGTAETKETYYFVSQKNPVQNERHCFESKGWEGFREMFSGDKPIRIEATTHNFHQKIAIREITSLDPEKSLIVFLLRKPVERLVSSFNYAKYVQCRVKRSYSIDTYLNDVISKKYNNIHKNARGKRQKFEMIFEPLFSHYTEWIKKWAIKTDKNQLMLLPISVIGDYPKRAMRAIDRNIEFDMGKTNKNSSKIKNEFKVAKFPKLQEAIRYNISPHIPKRVKSKAKSFYRRVMFNESKSKELPSRNLKNKMEKKYKKSMELVNYVEKTWKNQK